MKKTLKPRKYIIKENEEYENNLINLTFNNASNKKIYYLSSFPYLYILSRGRRNTKVWKRKKKYWKKRKVSNSLS